MLSSSDIAKLERAGITIQQLRVVTEIIEKRYQALNKSNALSNESNAALNDNLTPSNANLTRKSNAEYQRDYRKRRKNNDNSQRSVESVKSNESNADLTPSNASHIENAHTHVRDNSLLSNSINKKESKKRDKRLSNAYTPEYENFISVYPPNNGTKAQGFVRYQQALTHGVSHEVIIEGARRYAAFAATEISEKRYIKHYATWIYQRGWECDYSTEGNVVGLRSNGNGTKRGKADEAYDVANKYLASVGAPLIER